MFGKDNSGLQVVQLPLIKGFPVDSREITYCNRRKAFCFKKTVRGCSGNMQNPTYIRNTIIFGEIIHKLISHYDYLHF